MKKKVLTKRSLISLSFVLVLVFAVSAMFAGCNNTSSSQGDNSWEKIKEKGVLVLGLDDNFPPMGFRDGKGEIIGFDIDVAREVCSRLGIELKLQSIDWSAKEQELNSGNIDCIWNGFTITEERKENVLFTEPYMKSRQIIIVLANSPYNQLSDLEGKKLGLQAESSADDALNASEDFKSKLKEVVYFDDNYMAFMDLVKGGVDAVLMDEPAAKYYMQLINNNIRIFDKELAIEQYGIGFRKSDKALMQKVQKTLKEMAKDGKLAEISNKWFGEDITIIGK